MSAKDGIVSTVLSLAVLAARIAGGDGMRGAGGRGHRYRLMGA